MVFAIGVLLFALGIGASIALHEAGHMWTAKALGMKVRRYYIGFGPKIFSFRRGETEYGLKAIPAGGFCDIAGMTAVDELAPDEVDRAMYKQKAWKRIVVMSGGIAMNFLLGFVLIIVLAVGWGLPSSDNRAVVGNTVCYRRHRPEKTAATNWRSARVTARRAGGDPGRRRDHRGERRVHPDVHRPGPQDPAAERHRGLHRRARRADPHDRGPDPTGPAVRQRSGVDHRESQASGLPRGGAIGIQAPPGIVKYSLLGPCPRRSSTPVTSSCRRCTR